MSKVICERCSGTGNVGDLPCAYCAGQGYYSDDIEFRCVDGDTLYLKNTSQGDFVYNIDEEDEIVKTMRALPAPERFSLQQMLYKMFIASQNDEVYRLIEIRLAKEKDIEVPNVEKETQQGVPETEAKA